MNNQQPDALRLAVCCDMKANACREGTPPYIERKQTAAELRRLHAENLSLHQSYKAARLEIDSLKAQRAQSAPTDDQVLAITTAYEQGVGKGREAYTLGKKVDNPYSSGWNCDHAWSLGYVEGKGQAERKAPGNQKLSRCSKLDGGSSISGEEHTDVAVPYGVVTTHSVTGQQFFYRWPEPPYLDNAKECVTVYTLQPMQQPQSPTPIAYLTYDAYGSPAMLFFDKDEALAYCEIDFPTPLYLNQQAAEIGAA